MFEPEAMAFFAHFHRHLKIRNAHQFLGVVVARRANSVAGEMLDRMLLSGIAVEQIMRQPRHLG